MNLFEKGQADAPADTLEYEELSNVISMEDFDYADYRNGELEILQPRLVALGFSEIRWYMGDHDSFGPLTRVCFCRDKTDKVRQFVYG